MFFVVNVSIRGTNSLIYQFAVLIR